MAENQTVAAFRKYIEKAFSRKMERIADQRDFNDKYQHEFTGEYKEAMKLVLATKDADTLIQLMNAYLELYSRYRYNTNNIHYYMSDVTFQWLFYQSTKVDHKHGDLFETWDKTLTGNPVSDSYNSFKKRYLELDINIRTSIDAFRVEERKKRQKDKSILDKLRDEYARQMGFPAKSDDDLHDFDPKTSVRTRSKLEEQAKKVELVWNSANNKAAWKEADVTALDTAVNEFAGYLKTEAAGDVLVLFQLLKYLRDVFVSRRETMKGKNQTGTRVDDPDSEKAALYYVLYTLASLRIMAVAQSVQLYAKNRYGFTDQEIKWFLQPIKSSYQYYSNLERVFRSRLLGKVTVEVLVEELKVFLNMRQLNKCQLKELDWVDLAETLRIQKMWSDIKEFSSAVEYAVKRKDAAGLEAIVSKPENQETILNLRSVSQTSIELNKTGAELGKKTVTAGSHVGSNEAYGGITIVYIDPANHDRIYIEFDALKPNLFRVREIFAARNFYGAMILQIYKSTQGVVIISQLIFMAMGFIQILVASGFAAMIYEVVLTYTSHKVSEQIAKLSPTAARVFDFVFMAAAPRPHFGPKVNMPENPRMIGPDNTGLSKALNFTPKNSMLEAESGALVALEKPTTAQVTRALEQQAQVDAANLELRGTWRKAIDKVKDIAGKAPAMTTENAQAAKAKLADLVKVEPLQEPAFAGAPMMRSGGKSGMNSRGTGGGSGGTGTAKIMSRSEARIRKSADFKSLQEYQGRLTDDMLQIQKKEIRKIFDGLSNKTMGITEAEKKVTTLLNNAKEATGEFVADGLIYSNYKVLSVVNIPSRSSKVPILDRVFKVRDEQTGQIKFILSEVKGGERTRLGEISAYNISFKNGNVIWTKISNRTVTQASPEWYWQRIVEIYESPGGKKLANDLLNAIQEGRIEPFVIKSGLEMAPKFRIDKVSRFKIYFKNKALPK